LQDAFAQGLKTPLAVKIFKTIPDHVFWDIKKPIGADEQMHLNKYNPARAVYNSDFFDIRTNERWMHERKANDKLAPSVSLHRNY
jgi:hypothetical protein